MLGTKKGKVRNLYNITASIIREYQDTWHREREGETSLQYNSSYNGNSRYLLGKEKGKMIYLYNITAAIRETQYTCLAQRKGRWEIFTI